jgi:hypothetical protein
MDCRTVEPPATGLEAVANILEAFVESIISKSGKWEDAPKHAPISGAMESRFNRLILRMTLRAYRLAMVSRRRRYRAPIAAGENRSSIVRRAAAPIREASEGAEAIRRINSDA